jgi:hypothetical protein
MNTGKEKVIEESLAAHRILLEKAGKLPEMRT